MTGKGLPGAGEEVVQADDASTVGQQLFAQVGAEEADPSGDHGPAQLLLTGSLTTSATSVCHPSPIPGIQAHQTNG